MLQLYLWSNSVWGFVPTLIAKNDPLVDVPKAPLFKAREAKGAALPTASITVNGGLDNCMIQRGKVAFCTGAGEGLEILTLKMSGMIRADKA